jgi:peptidyl-prolyl cis-trans isomerase C
LVTGLRRVGRSPVLHFLAIGGVLFVLAGERGAVPTSVRRAPIVFTAADVERLRRGWMRQFGSPPSAATEAHLIDAAIDEEVLYREALALGLDRREGVIRDRLVRLARFVDENLPEDAAASEAVARQLGLDRHDLVIRRHLVNSMRLALSVPQPSDQPTAAALAVYYDEHGDEYRQPARVRFVQVYLSRDRRGDRTEADARRLLGELRSGAVAPEEAARRGDPFIRGAVIGPAPTAEVERLFGADFAAAVARAGPHVWLGPIASSYGLHLIWVDERIEAGRPPLAEVRGRVLHQFLHERERQRLRRRLAAIRARYDITVEGAQHR